MFIAELETLCEKYKAHCDLTLKKKPFLEHICAVVNVKIDHVKNS
jgi:hypothetical protein